MPIPDPEPSDDSARYSKIILENRTYYDLMTELGMSKLNTYYKSKNKSVNLTDTVGCHLDPDINNLAQQRVPPWKALFGQTGSAQGHLNNPKNPVEKDDLFLFFGTFRETTDNKGQLKFVGSEKHIIFGYLQIGNIINIKSKEKLEDWMNYHPHYNSWEGKQNTNNTIYVASEQLSLSPTLPGAGIFKFDTDLVLTADGQPKSYWKKLPFAGKISYHNKNCWKENLNIFKSARIGQEFVCQEDSEITEWAKKLIAANSPPLNNSTLASHSTK